MRLTTRLPRHKPKPPPLPECPYVQPGTPAYQLTRALYDGEPIAEVCARLSLNAATARSILLRLRRRASAYVARPVNETFTLRLLFDRTGAERAVGIDSISANGGLRR